MVITTSDLYTGHLHGIEPVAEDTLARHGAHADISKYTNSTHAIETNRYDDEATQDAGGTSDIRSAGRVVNWAQLQSEDARRAVAEGGKLSRGTRLSLTCRDVEKVARTKMY